MFNLFHYFAINYINSALVIKCALLVNESFCDIYAHAEMAYKMIVKD